MYKEHLNVTDKEMYVKFKSCLTHQIGSSDKNYTQPFLVGGLVGGGEGFECAFLKM